MFEEKHPHLKTVWSLMDIKFPHNFKRIVCTGSKCHDFVVEFLVNFTTLFSETSLNRDKLGVVHMDDMTVDEEAVKISRILLIS